MWGEGDILSLDSGGNYHGYIGDICRMAIQGEPDAELEDMLADIEEIQRAAMKPIKAGVMGSEVYRAADERGSPSRSTTTTCTSSATAWGWSATRRRGSPQTGPVPYDDYDAHRPLETGMVISVETTLRIPSAASSSSRTPWSSPTTGYDIYGDGARGWNRGGTRDVKLNGCRRRGRAVMKIARVTATPLNVPLHIKRLRR